MIVRLKNTFEIRHALSTYSTVILAYQSAAHTGRAKQMIGLALHKVRWRANTNHYTKEVPLRDLSLCVLIDLHQPLRIRPNGDDHPTRTRELLHKRRRYRPRRRSDMNSVIRGILSVPFQHQRIL